MDVLEHLLTAAPARAPIASLAAWLDHLAACPWARPIDRALWAGFEADRLGYAFVGGYGAALARLLGVAEVPATMRVCIAATERGGAHPRAIETRLRRSDDGAMTLDGEKTFATLASASDEVLVVASRGEGRDGKSDLAVVRVRAGAPGMTIEDRPALPFSPEIPHARVTLEGVAVRDEDVLPGDGYARYVKPFRTLEDTHVLAATLAYVLKAARAYRFRASAAEGAFAIALALRSIAELDPSDPAGHVALAGAFHAARALFAEHEPDWEKADDATRDRWRRDQPLFAVAENARQKRSEAAWGALASRGSSA